MRKVLLANTLVALLLLPTVTLLSTRDIQSDDAPLLAASSKLSKSMVMQALDQFHEHFGDANYAPTPFQSNRFSYADLDDPYFKTVRQDSRVASFFGQQPIDFQDAVALQDWLRELFPHGQRTSLPSNARVLDLVNAAEKGDRYLCGTISRMLVQLLQAGGTQARTINIESEQSGHVVVEMWSHQYDKWILLDPDYNVHYTDAEGTPLSAWDLYLIANDDSLIDSVRRNAGKSSNTLFDEDSRLIEDYYRNGFAVLFYNRWATETLGRKNPMRSPAIMGYYIGPSDLEQWYYKHDTEIPGDDVMSVLYGHPNAIAKLAKL